MTAAAESVPGTDSDRASFTAALETARDQPEDGEDEHVVAEALAAFQRDLSFRLMLWYEAAEDAFGNLIDHDRAIRQRLAAQLERLDQESILFGARPAA